ncbi:hypothetical protein KO506_00075 [Polaribacter vadi]|uniref:hypothetical protein n=1 Tax=Polaribacter TaxID=52959 RepID=UPI001C0A47F7|nr:MULTISPECIES: hypothetical protein [Polaribacter]MBU3009796.1 hypothetical protein [Polaribacter vadi]MDO6739601.1 hypothetical protein [Polaribacter sp. 1_MG-2023]
MKFYTSTKSNLFLYIWRMNPKWYFSALLVLFTFLGTFHENIPVPNQEIVLEFNNSKINDSEKEFTLADIKNRLTTAGASNIKIQEAKNGRLKISYYSSDQVSYIKEALSQKNEIAVRESSNKQNQKKYPSEKKSKFNFDVYELENEADSSNFDGNSIIEIKYDSDRYTNQQNYASSEKILLIEANTVYKSKSRFYKQLFIVKNSTSHNIPEVRAGPFYYLS